MMKYKDYLAFFFIYFVMLQGLANASYEVGLRKGKMMDKQNETKIADTLIKVLGKDVNDPLVYDTLHHWGLSQDIVKMTLKSDGVVCGGRENKSHETNILVYGRKEITRIEFWTTDKSKQKEMELPFGVSRFSNKEILDNFDELLEVNGQYYSFDLELDEAGMPERAEVSKLSKTKYNELLSLKKELEKRKIPDIPAKLYKRLEDINADTFETLILNNPNEMKEGSVRYFRLNAFDFTLRYGYDKNQVIEIKGKGINCVVEYKNNQVSFLKGFEDANKTKIILEGFNALDQAVKKEIKVHLEYLAYKEIKAKQSRAKGAQTRKINKLSSEKLKNFATYILRDDSNYDLIDAIRLVIDWRQEDESIVNDCESLLKTGELKAELVNVDISTHNPHGYEIYIHYKGKKHLVEYGQEVRRWKTINRLNQVISDTYQMRLLLSSLDSDTHELIVLSHPEWQELEKVLGKEKVAEFVEFVDNEFF